MSKYLATQEIKSIPNFKSINFPTPIKALEIMESIVEEYSKIEGREAFYIRAAADGFLKTIGNHGGLHTEDYFTIVYIPVENTDSLVRFFHKGNEVKFAYEWTDRGQLELFLCFSRMKRAAKDAKKYAYRDAA